MEILGLLTLGLFLGMSHAMEADHLAAVSSMWCLEHGRRSILQRTLYWSAGHGMALLLLCGILLLSGNSLPAHTEALLELAAAALVIWLGLQLLLRLRRQKIHFHVHEHDGHRHIHAHSHICETGTQKPPARQHQSAPHHHKHPKGHPLLMAMLIGIVHGAAGTGGLMVLVVAATHSILLSFVYVAVFCCGTVVGMTALTFIVSMPLSRTGLWATRLNYALSVVIACTCFWTGAMLAYRQLLQLGMI